MKGYRFLSFGLLLALCSTGVARAFHTPPPENLSLQKQRLRAYHDSGSYYHDISGVTQRALQYLKFRINQNKRLANPKQLAIVLEIDETALSNYKDMLHLDFGGTKQDIETLQEIPNDPAIPYTRTLYTFAKNNGISIFFITNRRERLRNMTEQNLLDVGYNQWAGLFMRPDDYNKPSVVPYRVAMRKHIVDMGYDIIFNVGDQASDFKGGYSDMAFKLPDPFYLVS